MALLYWRKALLTGLASIAIAGCLPESQEKTPGTQAPVEAPPNSAPAISGSPATQAMVGVVWQFRAVASDPDGDPVQFRASGLPAWATVDAASGLVSGTPSSGDVGQHGPIIISATDGTLESALPPFLVTVAPVTVEPAPPPPPASTPPPPAAPVNTAPVISGVPSTTVQATRAYSFTPSATDAETPQALTYSIANRPAWASFSTTTGQLSGTPSATQTGTYGNIRISVSDGSLTSSLPAFSITVTAPPNRAPVISGSPATSVTAGTAYSFRPTASDPDGQRLTFSISNRPAWATFSTSTGQLSGTPTSSHVGTTSNIVITASDGTLTTSLPAFSITVSAQPNRAPTISGTPSTTATVGTAYRFRPTASDPDGDTLSWSISGRPTGATFSTVNGELSFTPTEAGTWSNIVITVTDPSGASASLPAFTITVAPPAQTGSAELSWSPPTQYTDGSPLPASQISAFVIYRGSSASNLNRFAEVDSGTTRFTVNNLQSGTHYFAVTTVTVDGAESSFSGVGSKTIP